MKMGYLWDLDRLHRWQLFVCGHLPMSPMLSFVKTWQGHQQF